MKKLTQNSLFEAEVKRNERMILTQNNLLEAEVKR
jgi:hypothetical protein